MSSFNHRPKISTNFVVATLVALMLVVSVVSWFPFQFLPDVGVDFIV
jgi:hypothetical protein